MLVSRAGRDAPLSAVSDMKGALGLVGVFLSFLLDTAYGQTPLPSECRKGNNCLTYCTFCLEFGGKNPMGCLDFLLNFTCFNKFMNSMEQLNSTDHCEWRNVNGFYSNLSHCTEEISDCLLIPWPNPLVERRFVELHEKFFMDCPIEELSDPPAAIILALVITPICLIPIMVGLVVLKTKNGDGSS
ncbi:receptor activity-modifying protein 2 isoform X2 [Nelusetta ayraudi]|uniref:receptor activity-modifying protein 2 isoform X2 n=1 Tax=Nelusetta ayraudi TaxID=303726 RepID=UPI003F724393